MYLISCWGSSGAGKSTVALAIAAELSRQKRSVLVVSMDTRTPMLPVYLPTSKEMDSRNSAGSVFSAAEISEAVLKDKILRHPKNPNLFFMGMTSGETVGITCDPPKRAVAQEFLQFLMTCTPFDYVIVDGDSFPMVDQVTMSALELADYSICVLSPDVKGYEFYKAQRVWMANYPSLRIDSMKKIANPIYPHNAMPETRTVFGGFDYELPWSEEVAAHYIGGEPLTGFSNNSGVRFTAAIRALIRDLQGEEMKKYGNYPES